jgi:hypothetical protein
MEHLKTIFLAMIVLGLAVSLSFGEDGTEEKKSGPSISFQSQGWDGTKSFYQGVGTATVSEGGIDIVEYFLNDEPDYPGTGTAISGASGLSPLQFRFSIPAGAMKSGDNTLCFDAMSRGVWGAATCISTTK